MINVNYFLIFYVLVFSIISGGGADYLDYYKWSDYFSNYDLNIFEDYNKSENGLPLSSWYYGSGILSALINELLFLNGKITIKINSILITCFNIILINKILEKKKYYGLENFALICLFFFIFPAGFYINKFSSESWTILFSLLAIYYIETKKNNGDYISSVLIGIFLYFLVLIKPSNIFLCISLIAIFYFKYHNSIKIKNIVSKKFIPYSIIILLTLLSIFLILNYQKILLGNYFSNFYSFGNDDFESFSLQNFKLYEVIFSTWHGLLFYHPVYLILNLYFMYLFLNKNLNNKIRYLILINFALFLSQIFIQSSHATWWMGTGTYGARGFAGVSIITFYLLISFPKRINTLKFDKVLTLTFFLFLTWHTYLLTLGVTNFVNLNAFVIKLTSSHSIGLLLKIILSIFILFFLKNYLKKNNINLIQISLIILAFFIILDETFSLYKTNSFLIIIGLIILSYLFFFLLNKFDKVNILLKKYVYKLISFIFILSFLTSFIFQFKLFNNFNLQKNENFQNGENFNCNELISSFNEYNSIDGYDNEKSAWKKFIDESKCKL